MKVASYALDGLQTDPGPFSGAADGALVDAHNVVLERKGLIEPRGGLKMFQGGHAAGYQIQHGTYPLSSILYTWAESGGAWSVRGSGAITGPSLFIKGRVHSALVRGRLLFTSEQGVCEAPSSGTGIAYRAGLPQPSQMWGLVTTGGTAGTWLANNQSVAYRFTLVRTRSDGSVMESAPTPPFIVRNTSGASGGVTLIPAPGLTYTPWDVNSTFDAIQAGDELRVYRAPILNAATGVPSDVMALRTTLTITAGVVQTFVDAYGDTEWNGPFLYTNAKQEGILQARARPAYARDICQYNGMTLYAGHKTTQRLSVTLKSIGDIAAEPQETICSKTMNVTTAIGTVNLTAIAAADVKYIVPGQWITIAYTAAGQPGIGDARFTVDTQIATVNYGAGTATITKNALASGVVSVTVWDWIGVTDGATTYRQWAEEAANTNVAATLWRQAHGATGVTMGGYADLEFKWNNAATRVKDVVLHATGNDEVNGKPEFRGVLCVFERASFSTTPFTIKSTKPRAFTRPVTYDVGIASMQDGGNARIGMSVNDIPDAVPDTNTLDVGDLSSPIYRIVPSRSGVLVFKGDGVFVLFGNTPQTISVNLLDATVVPPFADISANWITARGGSVYMMSSRGPMAVTEMGATPFGTDIMETLRELYRPSFELAVNFTACAAGSSPGSAMVCFASNDATLGARMFVYNTLTGAWSTWSARKAVTAMWDSTGGLQGFGLEGNTATYYDRRDTMGVAITSATWPLTGDYYDAASAVSCTINTVTPNGTNRYTIVIAAGSLWTPTVGDVLLRGGVLCVVESVASATTFDVVSGGVPTAGIATWEESYPVRLTWTARTLGTITEEKRNIALSFAFSLRALLLRLTSYFQSAYAPGGVQTVAQPAITGAWDGGAESLLAAPEIIPLGIPLDVVLDWGLRVGLSIQQARSWFSLGAVVVEAESSGTRTGRNRA